MVHGWSGREGDFALEVRVIMDGQESCEDAQEIFLDTSLTGDTGLGFTSSFPECGTTNDPWSADVFFKFVAPNIGLFELDTCENSIANSHTDTKINVYSGGCDAPVCLNGNDDKCGFRSSLTFNSTFAGKSFQKTKTNTRTPQQTQQHTNGEPPHFFTHFSFPGKSSLLWFTPLGGALGRLICELRRSNWINVSMQLRFSWGSP